MAVDGLDDEYIFLGSTSQWFIFQYHKHDFLEAIARDCLEADLSNEERWQMELNMPCQ